MSADEFQRKYHDYNVKTKIEAETEAAKITVEGHTIVPVEFPNLGWCLMLSIAYEEIKRLGIVK